MSDEEKHKQISRLVFGDRRHAKRLAKAMFGRWSVRAGGVLLAVGLMLPTLAAVRRLLVLSVTLLAVPTISFSAHGVPSLAQSILLQPDNASVPKVSVAAKRILAQQPAAPISGSGFGLAVGSTLQSRTDQGLSDELNDIASAGFKWIRFDMEWVTVQPNNAGQYDWSAYDRIVNVAVSKGLNLLPTLAYTPSWAQVSGCTMGVICAPADSGRFATFAAAAAARYVSHITNWEVWNEPNLAGFWQPAPSASAYAALLKATYPAIRKASPSSRVITGGLGSLDGKSASVEQLLYVKQLYAAGAKPYFDSVGYHPYSYPALPSEVQPWSGWSKMGDLSESIRSIMVDNGDDAKTLWLTEYGAPTNGPGSVATVNGYNPSGAQPFHEDEALQAATATDAINYVRNNSTWVGPLFWYSYRDLGTSTSTNENFFGLLRADGSKKPSYYSFKNSLVN